MVAEKKGHALAGAQAPPGEGSPEAPGPLAQPAVGDLLSLEPQAEPLRRPFGIAHEGLGDRSRTPITRAHDFPFDYDDRCPGRRVHPRSPPAQRGLDRRHRPGARTAVDTRGLSPMLAG